MHTAPLSLLINTIPLLGGEETGIGTYTRQISRILSKNDSFATTFYHGFFSKELPSNEGGGSSTTQILGGLKHLIKKIPYARTLAKGMIASVRKFSCQRLRHFDCYFEPNFLVLPEIRANQIVCTAHDFSCFLYPDFHPKERVRDMQAHFPKSIAKCSHIITVSCAMRKEAMELFGIASEKISVIHNGYDRSVYYTIPKETVEKRLSCYDLPHNFLLFAGSLEPRKNLSNLLAAYQNLPTKVQEHFPLLLAGGHGWCNSSILEQIRDNRYVRYLGYVQNSVLAALYTRATCFCYLSWYEGFGIPLLEAMACGCPVLSSNHAALCETCGDAAVFVAPDDIDAISHALLEFIEDDALRMLYSQRGLARVQHFSWEKTALAHAALFQKLCSR